MREDNVKATERQKMLGPKIYERWKVEVTVVKRGDDGKLGKLENNRKRDRASKKSEEDIAHRVRRENLRRRDREKGSGSCREKEDVKFEKVSRDRE